MSLLMFSTPQEICVEIGIRIRMHRISQRLKQEELAQKAGVARKTIFTLEKTGKCTLENLIKVIYALGLESQLENFLSKPIISLEDLKPDEKEVKRVRGASDEF